MAGIDTNDCVVILVTDGQGSLLFGRRRDNKKYTLIAGHIKQGETPEEAAYREIKEESGLKATFLSNIRVENGEGGKLYFYSTQIQGEPTVDNDPDGEMSRIDWVDCRGGVPHTVWSKLAGPKGDANLIRQVFDMKKSEKVWIEDAGFADLSKGESDEIFTLLKHPHPAERSLSLKLGSVSPEHLAVGILDPHPTVFQAAFNHKDSNYALNHLAASTRDAAGNTIFDRHDQLLNDPRCTKDHIDLMASAVKNDANLPIQDQANRLKILESQYGYSGTNNLTKSESTWAHHLLYAGSLQHPTGRISRAENEETHEHLKPLKAAYEQQLKDNTAIEPNNAGLHDVGQISPKVVYHVNEHKLMVKPYEEEEHPTSGWGESTSQHLYHAAKIGHLHQQSFVSNHGGGKYNIPATVIKLEPTSTPVHKAALNDVRKDNPALEDEARKIGVMDFLTANVDRHAGNLMIQKNGHPLAIDNAIAFGKPGQSLDSVTSKPGVVSITGNSKTPEGKKAYEELIKNWWPTVSPAIKQAFQKRIDLISHPIHKERISAAFNDRVNWLDSKANNSDFADYAGLPLQKTLEGADFLHTQHDNPTLINKPDMTGVHEKLKMATPPAIKPHREAFELGLNQHKNSFKPIFSYDPAKNRTAEMGEEPKAIYQQGKNKIMIKPQVGPSTSMSAWSEMASQGMYHAGGIGHLHQKVHATTLANQKQGDPAKQPHAVAIHMEPDTMSAYEAETSDDPRVDKMVKNPIHRQSLKKMGVMDWLTDNPDRHNGNILVRPDGSPIAIDHGRSQWSHKMYAYGPEDEGSKGSEDWVKQLQQNPHLQKEFFDNFEGKFSDANKYGGRPDEETWQWWDSNKDKIRGAFKKHVDMLPGENARNRMMQSFDVRFNHLNDLRDASVDTPPDEFGDEATIKNDSGFKPTEKQGIAHASTRRKQAVG
jgi:hypothetical protein